MTVWSSWLAMWRHRPVEVDSPLPPADAAGRLADLVGPSGRRYVPDLLGHGRSGWLSGTVLRHDVRLVVRPENDRNSWSPVLTARLVPTAGGGSRLTGSLGLAQLPRAFSVLWLGLVGLGFVSALVVAAGNLVLGRWHPALHALPPVATLLGLLAFGFGLTTFGMRRGIKDGQILTSCLEAVLAGAD